MMMFNFVGGLCFYDGNWVHFLSWSDLEFVSRRRVQRVVSGVPARGAESSDDYLVFLLVLGIFPWLFNSTLNNLFCFFFFFSLFFSFSFRRFSWNRLIAMSELNIYGSRIS